MKIIVFKYLALLSLLGYFYGCDEYERTAVVDAITVNESSVTLFVGSQKQLIASPTDGTYTYQWTSEDPSVATVSQNGLLEAISNGSTSIIVSSGNLNAKVEVTSVTEVPLTDVHLSDTYLEFVPGAKKTIIASLIPENANDISKAIWLSENEKIAIVNEVGEITGIDEGVTNIIYKIGDISKSIQIDVAYTRPFNGPHILSASAICEIKAADFDFGGEGYAFHDSGSGDDSGQNGNYRKSHGDNLSTAVDIEGFGQNIGWTSAGEWLLYTVEVHDAGEYYLEVSTSVPGTGSFHIEIDGVNVTGTQTTPNTGSWGSFQWHPSPGMVLNLAEGKCRIKYYFEGGHNFKAMRFTKK